MALIAAPTIAERIAALERDRTNANVLAILGNYDGTDERERLTKLIEALRRTLSHRAEGRP